MNVVLDGSRIALWVLRLTKEPDIQEYLKQHSMAFSMWYVAAKPVFPLAGISDADNLETKNSWSLRDTLDILKQLGYSANELDPLTLRVLGEGMDLHDHWAEEELFDKRFSSMAAVRELLEESLPVDGSPRENSRLISFVQALGMSRVEKELVDIAITCSASTEISRFFKHCVQAFGRDKSRVWTTALNCTKQDFLEALSPTSALVRSGLIHSVDGDQLPSLSPRWLEIFTDERESLLGELAKPWADKLSTGLPARLSEEDQNLAIQVLENDQDKGCNILLYGAASQDKYQAVSSLMHSAKLSGWEIRSRPGISAQEALFVVQKLLQAQASKSVRRPALVISRTRSALGVSSHRVLYELFGFEPVPEDEQEADKLLLSDNEIPCIWLDSDVKGLPRELAARFTLLLPLLKARKQDKEAQLKKALKKLKLPAPLRKKVLETSDVSIAQVQSAQRVAQLLPDTFSDTFEKVLSRSVHALRDDARKPKESVTRYDISRINYSGRFGPEQILQALAQSPKGSVCLYGPSGTGKTQFVEYLASQLDIPLMVRRASDLLSKWVGDNEKNIAEAFEQAADTESIFFLDEGDSFLRNRALAHDTWQVTMVNELLQHMEQFPGIFILATNLFRDLDAAALRRFTFKLEFRPLSLEHKWSMLCEEAGLAEPELAPSYKQQLQDRLMFMQDLTAGDFATVKRQCLLLRQNLTVEEWLEQLKLEVSARAHTRA